MNLTSGAYLAPPPQQTPRSERSNSDMEQEDDVFSTRQHKQSISTASENPRNCQRTNSAAGSKRSVVSSREHGDLDAEIFEDRDNNVDVWKPREGSGRSNAPNLSYDEPQSIASPATLVSKPYETIGRTQQQKTLGLQRQLAEMRMRSIQIRVATEELGTKLQRKRLEATDIDARLVQAINKLFVTNASDELQALKVLHESSKHAWAELRPLEESREQAEDELNQLDFKRNSVEEKYYAGLQFESNFADAPEESLSSSDADHVQYSESDESAIEYPPPVVDYLSTKGDADLIKEQITNLRTWRARLVDQNQARAELGVPLDDASVDFLASFDKEHAQLLARLETVEEEADRLKTAAVEANFMDLGDSPPASIHDDRLETEEILSAQSVESYQRTQRLAVEPMLASVTVESPSDDHPTNPARTATSALNRANEAMVSRNIIPGFTPPDEGPRFSTLEPKARGGRLSSTGFINTWLLQIHCCSRMDRLVAGVNLLSLGLGSRYVDWRGLGELRMEHWMRDEAATASSLSSATPSRSDSVAAHEDEQQIYRTRTDAWQNAMSMPLEGEEFLVDSPADRFRSRRSPSKRMTDLHRLSSSQETQRSTRMAMSH